MARYRADLVAVRTAEKQRVEKLPGDAQAKPSVVASDVFGLLGGPCSPALLAGERDPKVLSPAGPQPGCVPNSARWPGAFTGLVTDQPAFGLGKVLARVDALDADLAELDATLGRADRRLRRGG